MAIPEVLAHNPHLAQLWQLVGMVVAEEPEAAAAAVLSPDQHQLSPQVGLRQRPSQARLAGQV